MRKDLEDRLYSLGRYKGGMLLRIAFEMSKGLNIDQSLDEVGRSYSFWSKLDNDLRDEVQEVGRLLAVERVVDATDQAITLLRDAATDAADTLIDQMQNAKNPRVKLQAATEILSRIGADHKHTVKVEGGAGLDINARLIEQMTQIWSEDEIEDDDSDNREPPSA